MNMKMNQKILVVEDEERIARWVQTYVENAGYECIVTHNGREAIDLALGMPDTPDLIVLDLMLPEVDGWTVCETIRAQSDVPIIILTARGAESDIIHGLKIGADDFVKKPFSPAELVARIEANLRRTSGKADEPLTTGNIALDPRTRECHVAGVPVTLTANQFDLLAFFMQHPNQVFSREQLIDGVFGIDYDSYERAIDIHIRRLRTKIEPDPSNPRYVQTVFGAGYRFSPGED